LFFAEREKAKTDLNPDVKLLKMLVIIAVIVTAVVLVVSFLNLQSTEQLKVLYNATAPIARAAGQVTQL